MTVRKYDMLTKRWTLPLNSQKQLQDFCEANEIKIESMTSSEHWNEKKTSQFIPFMPVVKRQKKTKLKIVDD